MATNEEEEGKLLVVINYYDQRPADDLRRLLLALRTTSAGIAFDTCVVVNRTSDGKQPVALPDVDFVHYRDNTGMNIGAWDEGWRRHQNYAWYLFLQDECTVLAPGWGQRFVERLGDSGVGLVGESLNRKWHRPWSELLRKKADRVALYMDFMARHGIDTGVHGGHARALVWAFRGDTLQAMDGFPCGVGYEECVAAEIAVSKRVESLGLRVEQLGDEPFCCFGHLEWGRQAKKTAEAVKRSGWMRWLPGRR